MKIIQINGWLGRLNGPLARFIAEQQADIVCLQEALKPKGADNTLFSDQYGYLEEVKAAGSYEHAYFAPSWGFPLGDAVVDIGTAVLSRFPITNEHAVHTYREYHVKGGPDPDKTNCRTIQTCIIELPGGKQLGIANYQGHLENPKGMGNEITIETMKIARDEAAKLPRPLIFCGDFNVWPGSPALAVLDDLKLRNLTIENKIQSTLSPAHRAPLEDRQRAACDYILASPEIEVKSFVVSEEVVSDHKALILEFDL